MVKKREDILHCVVESIRDVLENKDVAIEEDTDPILNLGMDSHDGVACACTLSDILEFYIPDEVNLFVDDEKKGHKRSRCVREIVDLVYGLINKNIEEGSHE